MKTRLFAVLGAGLALAACVSAPAPEPEPVAAVVPAVPVTQVSGLEERAPDVCKAKTYITALGQSGSVIPTLGITRKFRVVEFRGIEPQDYDPQRIVFRLDAAGKIYNIDCG